MEEKNAPARWERGLRALFLALFLITGFLHASSLTFGKSVISFFQWPAVAVGAAALFLRLFFLKRYLKNPLTLFLLGFLFSFALSSFVYSRFGLYENFRTFVFTAFQFFLLFAFPAGERAEERQKERDGAVLLFLAGVFLLSAASLVTFFAGIYSFDPSGLYYGKTVGFRGGRLFGAWCDPNIGTVAAALSFTLSFFAVGKCRTAKKSVRALSFAAVFLNAAVQFCYAVLADSRSGRIVFAFAAGFGAARTFFRFLKKKKAKPALAAAGAGVLSALLAFALYGAILLAVPGKEAASAVVPGDQEITVGRDHSVEVDFSNGRVKIWKSAARIWRETPLLGTSRAGIVPFARENVPDAYILDVNGVDLDSMHNLFFDLLASQGILGVLLFGAFGVLCVIKLVKKRKKIASSPGSWQSLTVVCSMILTACTMTEILYVISPASTLAWLSLSHLVQKGMEEE